MELVRIRLPKLEQVEIGIVYQRNCHLLQIKLKIIKGVSYK